MTGGAGACTAALLLVGPGLAPEAGMLAGALQEAWPSMPPLHVVLPAGAAPAPGPGRTLVCSSSGWVRMLAEALDHLRAGNADLGRVFILIDDHCPLSRCDGARLEAIFRIAEAQGLPCVAFVTYDWPWERTEPDSRDERGRTMTWASRDVRTWEGEAFAAVPRDFFRYNQCQPSVWDAAYLRRLCGEALAQGVDDPWSFENELFDGQEAHFVSACRWPTVHHGFLASGRVNPEALGFRGSAGPALRALRAAIRARFVRERGLGALLGTWGSRPLRAARRLAGRALRRLS